LAVAESTKVDSTVGTGPITASPITAPTFTSSHYRHKLPPEGKSMVARFDGKCVECSAKILAGADIQFYGRGRAAHKACHEKMSHAARGAAVPRRTGP